MANIFDRTNTAGDTAGEYTSTKFHNIDFGFLPPSDWGENARWRDEKRDGVYWDYLRTLQGLARTGVVPMNTSSKPLVGEVDVDMGTLMEVVEMGKKVETQTEPSQKLIENAAKLEAAGFISAAKEVLVKAEQMEKMARLSQFNYIEVTHDNICKFLNKKLALYEIANGRKSVEQPVTCDYSKGFACTLKVVGSYYTTPDYTRAVTELLWKELHIEDYAGIPPIDIVDKLAIHKARNIFDEFTVASLKFTKKIVDPIIFGRINNDPRRFFIAQWGEDIHIEDLM